jgi:hypothetical protein
MSLNIILSSIQLRFRNQSQAAKLADFNPIIDDLMAIDAAAGLPGGGITSLNGLIANSQTFAVGSAGVDFGISSVGSTHTFNIPTASAVNRGLLSAADWTTFNSKGNGTVTSVSGTVNRITSTGGATPVIDISAAYVGQSSITTLGIITTGTWNATAIGAIYGGTGLTSYTTGDTLYASAPNVLSTLPIGTTGQVLTVIGGIPTWATNPGTTDWSLTGNTGLTDGVNNIFGTTDGGGAPIRFVVAGNTAGVVNSNGSTALGYDGFNPSGTGTLNTSFGAAALANFSSGFNNVAIGWQSGQALTTGGNNTLIGKSTQLDVNSRNFAIVIGSGVTSVVPVSGATDHTVTIGDSSNVHFAFWGALAPNNLTGTIGQILTSQGAGTSPIWATPSSTGWLLTGNATGNDTSFLGTTDNHDVSFQTNSIERARILKSGEIGIGVAPVVNTALTVQGTGVTTSSRMFQAQDSSSLLYFYIDDGGTVSSTLGYWIGPNLSLKNNGDATNIYVGAAAGGNNLTNAKLVAVGRDAFVNTVGAIYGVAIGFQAGEGVIDAPYLVAVGALAMQSLNAGPGQNVAVGYAAMNNATSSTGVVVVGFGAGDTISTGSRLTILGANADVSGGAFHDSIALGQGAIVTASNQLMIGSTGSVISEAYIGTSFATPNAKLFIGTARLTTIQTGNAGLVTGDLYVDSAANILANGDQVVGRKV